MGGWTFFQDYVIEASSGRQMRLPARQASFSTKSEGHHNQRRFILSRLGSVMVKLGQRKR